MYFDFYPNSFFSNFLPSILFCFLVFHSSVIISKISLFNKLKLSYDYLPLIFFFLFFVLFSSILNFILLANKIYLIKYFFYCVVILLSSSFFFLNKNKLKKYAQIFTLKQKIIFFSLFILFLISILPISDADSLSSHLYFPLHILKNQNLKFDLYVNHEILSFSNNEIILFLSPLLNSDNFGSILNIFTLFIFFILFKKKINFFLVIISCPLILFLISTQKLQIFFGLIYLLITILIFEKKKNNLENFVICLLIVFYSTGKLYYPLFVIPLVFIFLFNNKKDFIKIILFFLISFIFIFFPILLLKYNMFGNPFAPFLSNIFITDDFQKNLSYALRSSEGWLDKKFSYLFFLRPFFTFEHTELTTVFGIIFLFFLFCFKQIKKIYYLPYVIIFIVILTGQILPRYYLESFLVCIYFCKINERLLLILFSLQYLIILIVSVIFLYNSYFGNNVLFNKNLYMENHSYQYFNIKELNSMSIKGNILNLGLARPSIFADKNIYSNRYLSHYLNEKNYPNIVMQFLSKNKINYILGNTKNLSLKIKCLNFIKIAEIYNRKSFRNYFKKKIIYKSTLNLIDYHKCN